MNKSNNRPDSMLLRFEEFHALPVVTESKTRKELVRSLQALVKSGKATISSDQVSEYLASDFELARILVYLLIEYGKVNSDQGMWQENIRSEWELLNRSELGHEVSRMPLYYAIRAYVARLTAMPELISEVSVDRFLIREIVENLTKSEIDRNSQVLKRATELLSLVESGHATSSSKWSDKKRWVMGIISTVIIGVLGWVGNVIVTDLDKSKEIFHPDCDEYAVKINQKSQRVADLEEPVLVSGDSQALPSHLHLWVAATLPVGSREFYPRDEVFPHDGKWEKELNPKLKNAKDVKRFAVFIVGEQGHRVIASHMSNMKKADTINWQPLNQDIFNKGEIVRCHGIHTVSVK